jgi:hypothetical protein
MVVLGLDRPVGTQRLLLRRVWQPIESAPAAVSRHDAVGLGLALLNWMVLLLLLCGLLLAKTLPTSTGTAGSDTVTGVASVTCHGKTCSKVTPVG